MNAQRNYLGIACTLHDPALALVDAAGRLVFAEAAERPLQSKRALHAPADAFERVQQVLEEFSDPQADLVVARTWSGRGTWRKDLFLAALALRCRGRRILRSGRETLHDVESGLLRWLVESQLQAQRGAGSGARFAVQWHLLRRYLADQAAPEPTTPRDPRRLLPGRGMRFRSFEHHLTHAAAACYSSPFERAACAVVDGWGEGSSSACFVYEAGRLRRLRGDRSRASLGGFYAMLCLACGFDPLRGEEGKVMGLAAHGRFDARVAELLRPYVVVRGLRLEPGLPLRERRGLVALLARHDRADVAHTGQQVFEERLRELLGNLATVSGCEALVFTGGCALNSSANGKIVEATPFRRLYVPSAPGDDGTAAGAALHAFRLDRAAAPRRSVPASPYTGSRIDTARVQRIVRTGRMPGHRSCPGSVHEEAARRLAQGRIVAWVQGRAEFGPRALGNRSILADPRDPGIQERLNRLIKFREGFRPFAPSILHEHGSEWFENYQESPYMERTLRFRPGLADRVPGVVHVDGTGRLQSVRRESNERFHDLIAAFHRIAGVPLVLNTSFNVMGKPIVHSAEDAVATFYSTGLDTLILEDQLFDK